MGLRYGGKIVDDYSAMRGPCPSGFHVPSKDEWVALCGILTTTFSIAKNSTTMGTYLKMPPAGYRSYSSAGTGQQGGHGRYWSYTPYSPSPSNYAYYLFFSSSTINPQNYDRYTYGLSVRGFKDSPVIPDSSWTTLYDGSSVATGAGIYHNPTLGLISISSDGSNWVTIADKNLGATTVYNSGDTVSESNCGKYYQRGNNYGFTWTGTVATSSTQVDARDYGPGNYYSSSTFITGNSNWSSYRNDNLRGGETGVQQRPTPITKRYYGGKMVDDYSAMRGPCPSGFHVPIRDELTTLYSYMNTLGLADTGANFKEKLLLPNAGRLKATTGQRQTSIYAYLKSCTSYNTYGARTIQIATTTIYHGNNDFNDKIGGDTIRPFKDISVSPESSWTTLYDGSNIAVGAGVFHNESLGLISVSSDGINWITIADKNLGATTVYNTGDTLSEANCGKFYQWGNNYGFPWGGATTTSATQVDASNYGPGNYYYSDTFITGSRDWSSVTNANLRGGETGVQQRPAEVIKVYKGNTLIREKS